MSAVDVVVEIVCIEAGDEAFSFVPRILTIWWPTAGIHGYHIPFRQ